MERIVGRRRGRRVQRLIDRLLRRGRGTLAGLILSRLVRRIGLRNVERILFRSLVSAKHLIEQVRLAGIWIVWLGLDRLLAFLSLPCGGEPLALLVGIGGPVGARAFGAGWGREVVGVGGNEKWRPSRPSWRLLFLV